MTLPILDIQKLNFARSGWLAHSQTVAGGDRRLAKRLKEVDRDLRLVALRAERDQLFKLARVGVLEDDVMRRLV